MIKVHTVVRSIQDNDLYIITDVLANGYCLCKSLRNGESIILYKLKIIEVTGNEELLKL